MSFLLSEFFQIFFIQPLYLIPYLLHMITLMLFNISWDWIKAIIFLYCVTED